MAFVPPTFNLDVDWWGNNNWKTAWARGTGAVPDPDGTYGCQLRAPGFRAANNETIPGFLVMELLLPKLTDIRPPIFGSTEWQFWFDMVEVPRLTGRYYFVLAVDDVARGFMNEYRVAMITPTTLFQGAAYSAQANWPYAPNWPVPVP